MLKIYIFICGFVIIRTVSGKDTVRYFGINSEKYDEHLKCLWGYFDTYMYRVKVKTVRISREGNPNGFFML